MGFGIVLTRIHMKKIKCLILLLAFVGIGEAQYNVEWMLELSPKKSIGQRVSSVLFYGGDVFVSRWDGVSRITSAGTSVFSQTDPIQRTNQLQIYDGFIWQIGGELTKRDLNGVLLSKQELFWTANSHLTCSGGGLLNGGFYATKDFDYLFK